MRQRGHTFEVVSQDTTIRDELTLRPNTINRTVWKVDPSEMTNYDGVMIVSGNMADTEAYWDDKHVLRLIEASNNLSKAVAAICCSVSTIRTVAEGKKVSFYPLVRARHRLASAGAILQTVALTRDGNLVTAEHQMASQVWAEEYCNVLEGKPQEHFFTDSKFVPKGRERKPIPELEELKEKLRRKDEHRSNEGD
jgi:putative intracellular protease/amidase